jgi:Ca2+-binding EF-hand superfamily protein
MEQVDADGDDVIDQREFAEIMTEQPKVEAVSKGSRVVQSFQVFDADL